jgi:hypothetical protein
MSLSSLEAFQFTISCVEGVHIYRGRDILGGFGGNVKADVLLSPAGVPAARCFENIRVEAAGNFTGTDFEGGSVEVCGAIAVVKVGRVGSGGASGAFNMPVSSNDSNKRTF